MHLDHANADVQAVEGLSRPTDSLPFLAMNEYEAKLEARKDRLERASERATQASEAAFNASREATAGIPFGQPILVDHYSANRHRAALRRSDNALRLRLAPVGRVASAVR